MPKKFVYLGDANLKKILDWCDKNEDDPFAHFYLGACTSVGSFDSYSLEERLAKSRAKQVELGWLKECKRVGELKDKAFILRDSIGREILAMIKRETTAPNPQEPFAEQNTPRTD